MPIAPGGYRWKDKDFSIDLWRCAFEKSGKTLREHARSSGIAYSTLQAWDTGKTRKPQNMTLKFAMLDLGWVQRYVDKDGNFLEERDKTAANIVRFVKAEVG